MYSVGKSEKRKEPDLFGLSEVVSFKSTMTSSRSRQILDSRLFRL